MTSFILTLTAYLLDALIITVFLSGLFIPVKKFSKTGYFAALISVELILLLNDHLGRAFYSSYSKPINILISFSTTFLLCFFFDSHLSTKLFASFTFQIYVSAGEIIFTYVVSKINPAFFVIDNIDFLYNTMNCGSKIVLLILCISTSFFVRKEASTHHMAYNFLLLSTPLVTLFIYCMIPLKIVYQTDTTFFNILFICLAILNIINFILTRKLRSNMDLMFKNAQMQGLLRFQKEKYDQLSESYRQSRRLIHDVKKHYFSVNEFVSHNDIAGLQDYIGSAINDLESVYAKYNTGNLVIDSFLTSYESIFSKNLASFKTTVNVDCNRIPISDYDLCVVLGNILDNALEACNKTDSENRSLSIVIETTNNDKFIIHTENTYPSQNNKRSEMDILNHGYGLENIKKVVLDNNGFITIDASELFRINILIPIIEDDKRVNHPPTLLEETCKIHI